MEDLLRAEEVTISFDGRRALDGLSFSVRAGEIFGFLGPSGAGKTTTIKLLTRQLSADSGTMKVFGKPLAELAQRDFERMGILTDNSGFYERLTVRENLQIFARLYDVKEARIPELLEEVGLLEDQHKRAKNLSRGMKQRMLLARAVLHEPTLLFLDEPTAALDPGTTASIHDMLQRIHRRGTTIFLTTHNMEEADKLCGWVSFLDHGKIVEGGRPQELKLKYARPIVQVCTAEGAVLECEKTAEAIGRLMEQVQGPIATVHSQEPNLEEIFLQLTGRELA